MLTSGSSDYKHGEQVKSLKESLRYDPISPGEKRSFLAYVDGQRVNGSTGPIGRVLDHLGAPTRPAAYYSGLAVGQWDDAQRLTDQELDVIGLICLGADSQVVGRWIGCTTFDSAKNHGAELIRLVRGKLGARNNAHLVQLAYRYRIIEPVEGLPRLAPWPE